MIVLILLSKNLSYGSISFATAARTEVRSTVDCKRALESNRLSLQLCAFLKQLGKAKFLTRAFFRSPLSIWKYEAGAVTTIRASKGTNEPTTCHIILGRVKVSR